MSNTQPPNGPNPGEPYFGGGEQPQQPWSGEGQQPDSAPQAQGQSGQGQSWQQPQQQYGAAQPTYQQHGAQQQYGGQPAYQQGYGAQPGQPKKSKTPLIIGLVVGILVVAAAVVGLVFFLGDDDGDDSAGDDKLSGETLEGDGYSYTLAEKWQDQSASAAGATIDTVSALGDVEATQAQATLLVEVSPSGGQNDPEDLREQWEQNMSGATGAEPEALEDTEIGGEKALAVRFERTDASGTDIVQLAYLVVKDDTVYSIAFSTRAEEEDDRTEEFEQMKGSWDWE